MKKLYLIRHAHTVSGSDKCDDKDRKLTPDGIYQSLQLGAHLQEHGVSPDCILCSTAIRARETLANIVNQMNTEECDIRHEDSLYMAGPNTMLEALYKISDDMSSVLLVGHNPGIGELAQALAQDGADNKMEALRRSAYPTGTLAAFDFDVESWGLISDQTAYLTDFVESTAQAPAASQSGE